MQIDINWKGAEKKGNSSIPLKSPEQIETAVTNLTNLIQRAGTTYVGQNVIFIFIRNKSYKRLNGIAC